MATITQEKALNIIRDMIVKEGTQVAVAKKLDISPAYLTDILMGIRPISDNVARKLGYKRVTVYETLKEG